MNLKTKFGVAYHSCLVSILVQSQSMVTEMVIISIRRFDLQFAARKSECWSRMISLIFELGTGLELTCERSLNEGTAA